MGYSKIKNTKLPWSFASNRTPLPKDSSGEMELKAEQTAREIEEVSSSNWSTLYFVPGFWTGTKFL